MLPKYPNVKHWEFQTTTSAGGLVYYHLTRPVMIVVYHNKYRLFRDFTEVGFNAHHAAVKLEYWIGEIPRESRTYRSKL